MVESFLSLFAGAFGAAILGLLGAWIHSRREHYRWVRERRYDAYHSFLTVSQRAQDRYNRAPREDDEKILDEFSDALNGLRLVGPDPVWEAAWDYWAAFMDYGVSGWSKKSRKAGGLPAVPAKTAEESLKRLVEDRQTFVDEAQRVLGLSHRR